MRAAASFRERIDEVTIDLEPQIVVEREGESAAPAELIGQLELLVVVVVAAEPADLELVGMLGPQGPGPGRQQHPDDSDCPHGRLPQVVEKATPKIGISAGKRDTPSL